jgi:hypothetical protein
MLKLNLMQNTKAQKLELDIRKKAQASLLIHALLDFTKFYEESEECRIALPRRAGKAPLARLGRFAERTRILRTTSL